MSKLELGATTTVKASTCKACGYLMDAATCAMGNHQPVPGDVTICVECGHLMEFANDLTLTELSKGGALAIAGNKDLLLLQNVLAQAKKAKKENSQQDESL